MLSETTILELQQILLEEFSVEYDKNSVDEIAESLVNFVEILSDIENESLCKNAPTK